MKDISNIDKQPMLLVWDKEGKHASRAFYGPTVAELVGWATTHLPKPLHYEASDLAVSLHDWLADRIMIDDQSPWVWEFYWTSKVAW